MNTKFEFTGETKVSFGITFKQIRALASFGAVAAGEIGGWLEAESNLDISGDAWVFGDARVFCDSRVSGAALVSGAARVFGEASLLIIGPIGSRQDYLCVHADAKIGLRFTTGCFSGSEKEFRTALKATHSNDKHGKHYAAALDLALLMVKGPK